MTMVQIAMLETLTQTTMADAIFSRPLLAEGLNTLFAVGIMKMLGLSSRENPTESVQV
jgi:hypothetical protein